MEQISTIFLKITLPSSPVGRNNCNNLSSQCFFYFSSVHSSYCGQTSFPIPMFIHGDYPYLKLFYLGRCRAFTSNLSTCQFILSRTSLSTKTHIIIQGSDSWMLVMSKHIDTNIQHHNLFSLGKKSKSWQSITNSQYDLDVNTIRSSSSLPGRKGSSIGVTV